MPASPPVTGRVDVVVVGGGILGLACAWELSERHPDLRLAVLEREPALAAHQTGHNSGVIHAGVYYPPGSLKARLCVDGARRLERFCDERGIPFSRAGKLIVASERGELDRLRTIEERGRASGVPGLRWLDGDRIAEIEPNAVGVAALHSPRTGIVDYVAVCEALAAVLRERGHVVATDHEVTGTVAGPSSVVVRHRHGEVEAGHALFCAGAWSDRLAERDGADADPRIVPFRGAYLHVVPARQELVRGLIYPVPDPALPFLGVHLTRHVDGRLSIGPTALLVGALDAQHPLSVRPADAARTLAWPGTARMAWRFRRAALTELHHAASRRAVVRSAATYVPSLRQEDVGPGFSGVRAQALTRDGQLVDDFVFSQGRRTFHVRNAPSPAATSSLAIAAYVVDRFDEAGR
jgi:(S)-2-hydroxyglutarate dehydrogenase